MGKLRLKKWLVPRLDIDTAYTRLIKPKPVLGAYFQNIIIVSNLKIQTENRDLLQHHEKK